MNGIGLQYSKGFVPNHIPDSHRKLRSFGVVVGKPFFYGCFFIKPLPQLLKSSAPVNIAYVIVDHDRGSNSRELFINLLVANIHNDQIGL